MKNQENSINFNNTITPDEEKSFPTNKTLEQTGSEKLTIDEDKKIMEIISGQPVKKKSPTEYIESTLRPEIERVFIKYPREEIVDITDYSTEGSTKMRWSEVFTKERKLAHIHTHSFSCIKLTQETYSNLKEKYGIEGNKKKLECKLTEELEKYIALPSVQDLFAFMLNPIIRTMIIAVRNPKSGEVLGYNIIRKTIKTPTLIDNKTFTTLLLASNDDNVKKSIDLNSCQEKFDRAASEIDSYKVKFDEIALNGKMSDQPKVFEEFSEKYNLTHRVVSASGYKIGKTGYSLDKIYKKQ